MSTPLESVPGELLALLRNQLEPVADAALPDVAHVEVHRWRDDATTVASKRGRMIERLRCALGGSAEKNGELSSAID